MKIGKTYEFLFSKDQAQNDTYFILPILEHFLMSIYGYKLMNSIDISQSI